MANLVNCASVGFQVPERVLLDDVSLGVDDGDSIGVVGRNGDGKSTLLRILAGRHEPTAGKVSRRGGITVGMLDQRDDPAERTVREVVLGAREAHEWAGDARLRDVLVGLLGGLEAPGVGGLEARTDELSGGQLRRVALAAVLVEDPDLLLLDEPTNHLDVDGVAWLAEHLLARGAQGRGALVVVTHDRWFLDAVVSTTWEVHDATVDAYEGGYAAWTLARAERQRVSAVTEERRLNLVRKELAWLRRGPPARTSKPKFRIDAAESLIADEPPPRDGVALQTLASSRLGKDVLDLEDVRVDHPRGDGDLLHDVTWRLGPGDRVGVVGANGAGKTTLLKVLTGELQPDGGRVKRGKTVEVACLTQDLAELAPVAHLRAVEAVAEVAQVTVIGGKEMTASQLVEQLGFPKQRQWTPVTELSGGERRRLQLLRLLLAGPNVLLLDEPTNDLDTDSLAAMEDVLDSFAGTLVVVSHDRYLLERLCDRHVGLLGDGAVRDLPRGVDEYLELRRAPTSGDLQRMRPPRGDHARLQPPRGGRPDTTPADVHEHRSGVTTGEARAARKDASRLERRMTKLGETERKLHEELAANATDPEQVQQLAARLDQVLAEKAQVEEEWLVAAELGEAG